MRGLGYSFRGRNVFGCSKKLYPCVYWPEHPIAQRNGICYVHRIIAYETAGESMRKKHVHHKNEDPTDFKPKNLKPLPPAVHARRHTDEKFGVPRELNCGNCGKTLRTRNKRRLASAAVYCDGECKASGQARIEWPANAEIQKAVDAAGVEATARRLGVTGNAIRKRLHLGYYAKVR